MGGGIPRRYSIGLWLAAGSLAFLLCLYHLSRSFIGGSFLPVDQDSFYHARRIIDALGDPLGMYQFDGRIHAPVGAWVTWPWAYDMAMAFLAKALMALTGAADPMAVLAFVAPACVFVNAALLLGIASRLRLSLPMQALALLFFALSPMTQALHRVGMVDHHYIEYGFVLATLYLGLGWFEDLANRRRAVMLAVALGAAPAFHNGLFILQLPVLVTFAWLWVLKRPIDRGGALAFAVALAGTTAAFLVPSEPFRHGEFHYYLHSWFHLYAACCTALLCVLASMIRFTPAVLAGLAILLAAMAAPVLQQLRQGGEFIFGSHAYLERIVEFGNILRHAAGGQWWPLTQFYSPLLWLLPLGIGGLLWRLRRDAGNASLYFVVQTLIGTFLLLQTFRLHYFGSFALILPLCLLIDDARALRPSLFASRSRAVVLAALAAAALVPGLLELRDMQRNTAPRQEEAAIRNAYLVLGAACQRAQGAVLADINDGHPIRYYTECSTIADNFLTTPRDFEQAGLLVAMMAGPAQDVTTRAPYVRYILVRRADDVRASDCGLSCPENAGLRRELLLAEQPPARLRLLWDMRLQRDGRSEPFLRLFEVLDP